MEFIKNKELRTLAGFALFAVVLVALTLLLPIAGNVIHNDFWAVIWVSITQTAGPVGIGFFLVLCAFLMSAHYKSIQQGVMRGVIVFSLLSITVGGAAFFNEFVIKERLKIFRPSILYLEQYTDFDGGEFYAQEGKGGRSMYLRNHLKSSAGGSVQVDNKTVSNPILEEWIKSSGFSFPSGHSVTAFLLASLLGYYSLTRFKRKKRWMIAILYSWAVLIAYSRVLIGVHSAWDVSFGALWGTAIAFALIALGVLNQLWWRDSANPENPSQL